MAPEGMLAAGSVPVLAELLRLFNEISAPLRTSLTGPENPSTRTRELVVGGNSFYSNRLGWYRRTPVADTCSWPEAVDSADQPQPSGSGARSTRHPFGGLVTSMRQYIEAE